MNCPRCNFIIQDNQKKCLQCGINILGLKKCINISNRLYNKGLDLANNREFSNAIYFLKNSVLYNKTNFNSRNLLGLLYFKVGHFAQAMKQWLISTNYNDSKDNVAFFYIKIIQENMRQFEKGNDAVRLYNQSIRYLNKKNDDLAIIRLKNALKISPNFVDAMNLLTFCYIIQGKNKKALTIVQNTLKFDIKNKHALFYLAEINIAMEKNILEQKYISNGKVDIFNDIDDNYNSKPKINFSITYSVFMLIFGIVITYLFMYFLYIPDFKEKYSDGITQSKEQYESSKENYEALAQQIEQERVDLEDQIKDLQKQITEFNMASYLRLNRDKLQQVLTLIEQNKKDEALEIFNTINTAGFGESDLQIYEDIKSKF